MAPFFNVETGELRDPELYSDTPEPIASGPSPSAPTSAPAPDVATGRLTPAGHRGDDPGNAGRLARGEP